MLNKIIKWLKKPVNISPVHHCGFDFNSGKISICWCGRNFAQAMMLEPRRVKDIKKEVKNVR